MPNAAPWQPEQVIATNLFPDPEMVGGAAAWPTTGGTVVDGPEGGIKVTTTSTGFVIADYTARPVSGLGGAATLYVSAEVRATGARGVGVQVAQVSATGAGLGNAAYYAPPPPVGVWTRVTFPIPLAAGADHTSTVQLIRYSGGVAGETTEWRNLRFSIGADGPFFDGNTPADGTYSYRWTGAPNASTSEKYLPEILYRPLSPGEWRLDYEGTSFVFGRRTDPDEPLFLVAPDLGDVDIAADDTDRPRTDGVAFGVDYRRGRTITFEVGIVSGDEASARAALSAFRRAWRGDAVRSSPGTLASLTACDVTGQRIYYGRPRRFASVDEEIAQGVVTVVADFACGDDLAYSAEEHAVTVGLVPPPSGGLVAPLAAPLTTTPASATPGAITVAGDADAWPVVTISGPITNPTVSVTGEWDLALATTLAYDESVTVDTRPGFRSILRNDGAPLSGALTRSSVRLARAALAPGSYEVVLSGTDATGTSSMRFAWRDTLTS